VPLLETFRINIPRQGRRAKERDVPESGQKNAQYDCNGETQERSWVRIAIILRRPPASDEMGKSEKEPRIT